MGIEIATTYALPDEPAIVLAEENLLAPTNDGTNDTAWYRFQTIQIWRGEKLTEYKERLGLAKDFKANQFVVMGGCEIDNRLYIEETVGTLKENADDMRQEQLGILDFKQLHQEQEAFLRVNKLYF